MIPSREKPCLRCKRNKANQARGLCTTCYPKWKHLYPVLRNTRPQETTRTEADLDRLIEEQRKRLPDWWDD